MHQIMPKMCSGNALARSVLLINNIPYPKRRSSNPGHYLTCLLYGVLAADSLQRRELAAQLC